MTDYRVVVTRHFPEDLPEYVRFSERPTYGVTLTEPDSDAKLLKVDPQGSGWIDVYWLIDFKQKTKRKQLKEEYEKAVIEDRRSPFV